MTDLKPGDRVHIKGNWNWPHDCTGVVAYPPPFAEALADEHPWRGHVRTVPGRLGPISSVWVVFDEPQRDGDGDGPYVSGEVDIEVLTRIDEDGRSPSPK